MDEHSKVLAIRLRCRIRAADVVEGDVSLSVAYADVAGNAGVVATAVTDNTAVTIDLTAPTAESVTIVSSNSINAAYANAGDDIVVSIVLEEAITEPTIKLAGRGATVAGSGTRWTGTYRVAANQVTAGAASLSIEVTDVAGNVGPTCASGESCDTGAAVSVDVDAPYVVQASLRLNGLVSFPTLVNGAYGISDQNSGASTAGDTVTLSLQFNEPLLSPPNVSMNVQPETNLSRLTNPVAVHCDAEMLTCTAVTAIHPDDPSGLLVVQVDFATDRCTTGASWT